MVIKNKLLYSTVGIELIGSKPISTGVIYGSNYGYHNDAIQVADLYNDGNKYIIRGGQGSINSNSTIDAPIQIFRVTANEISLDQILYSNVANKISVGDFLNNGTKSIVVVAFTDSYPSTVKGSVFIPNGNRKYETLELLDLQAHGASLGQFIEGGSNFIVTPAQWPDNQNGLWLTSYDNDKKQVKNQKLTSDYVGPSSIVIPASKTSSPYVFNGQSSGGGSQDAIIPISIVNNQVSIDASKSIQFFPGYWGNVTNKNLALSLPTVQKLNQQNPLANESILNHVVEAQVGDLNSDGLPDVIASHLYRDPQSFAYGLTIYQQQSNGTFVDVTANSFFDFDINQSGPYKFYLADINRDGHLDILFGEVNYYVGLNASLDSAGIFNSANAALYINDGLGHFIRASTDQALFNQFKNRQIALIPQDSGNYSLATFDSSYNATPQFTFSLFQGIENYTGPNGLNPANRGAPGFNEWYYLNRYTDAANAVNSGNYKSGLDFYLEIGKDRGDTICAPGSIIYGSSRSNSATSTNGADVFIYHGPSSQYVVTPNQNGATVLNKTSSSKTDTLINVERLKFTDTNIALDIYAGQNAGMAYRMYKAALNRAPDLEGLGDWIYVLDNGANIYTDLARGFTESVEFKARYGPNISNNTFVTLLYNNVLGRAPDQDGLNAWVSAIEQRGASREVVLHGFSESPENISYSLGLIGQGMPYQEWLG